MQADVVQTGILHVPQGARHPVEKRLCAEEENVRPRRGAPRQMFAPAESYLQPHLGGVGHERARLERRLGNCDAR